ncbi:16S ribosomal RNA methyltransferase A [Halococcus saccharolyticus]|uniref:Probable ribosomal RNA small subunit methyltransferase A n=1 Tax=Halococcus saccharolyticus DSM 5350 TaxID=1227455 RepID=M0MTT6_9EURY|nr:16S ribosomal RNA methyltransferase A [Halococcus saccharolyticus]EMA47880.1 16S ribosomal RNA methyltransferase KsgA/Dim1 family protein [Halococcus saccharolyticus DSM 5350]
MTGRNRSSTEGRDPDALLARAGIQPDRNQDQHFLVDDRVLDRLPTYAEAFDTSHVLEIGAGTGALTDRLLDTADRVTAIERDARLADFLREEFADACADGRLDVVEGNALSLEIPEFSVSVSNLPYGVSSEVLFRLLPAKRPLVIMVQREFAERMVAAPGTDDYGRLSVTVGHYAECEIVETVPPEAFSPPPAVESAIVRTSPCDPDYAIDEMAFLAFVRAVFTQRRKTVRNAIRNTTHISEIEQPAAVVEAADEELLRKRAGDLTPEEFAALARLGVEVGGAPSEEPTSGSEIE